MDIQELREWFKNAPVPKTPFKVNDWTTVNDYHYFLSSHFEGAYAAKAELTRRPLIDRLFEMKRYIEENYSS